MCWQTKMMHHHLARLQARLLVVFVVKPGLEEVAKNLQRVVLSASASEMTEAMVEAMSADCEALTATPGIDDPPQMENLMG